MKKIFFCSLIFISAQAFSQISVGFTGGFLLPLKSNKDSLMSPYSAHKFGLEGIYSINPRWKLTIGIEYVSYKFYQNYQHYNIFQSDSNQFYFAQYLSIPIGIRYVLFPEKKIKPFIDGSISFMGNISHRSQFQNDNLITTSNPMPKSFILSPSLGAGILMNPTDKIYTCFMMEYMMQVGYVYQMYDNKNNLKNLRYNSINWQFSLGYNF